MTNTASTAPAHAASTIAPAQVSAGVAAQAAPVNAAKIGGSAKVRGGSRKTGGKKSRKMSAGAKEWVAFVVDVFNKKRVNNPKYKYMQAMRDASKLKKKNKTLKGGNPTISAAAAPTHVPMPVTHSTGGK